MSQTENIMKKISLDKVVLNMGVGKSGDAIDVAKKALDQISGKKSCARDAKETQRDFGVRKGEPIGVAVTIRGKDAEELLKRLLQAKGNQIKGRSFDDFGNFSFGILEHIDIPGIKYDPNIGILGLDVAVNLTRPGYNIRKRSKHKASVGKTHRISEDEAKEFMENEFGAVIV
ncbi:50S ribosomal protein L5 [Nitrosopumilus sp. b1]|uniref:50S ribosomal protein L5 n=1 Tax=Nitrosopumilus sp. b1 TaxID=2109907 RepID=UPI0015F5FD2B|nr:50S ribosomal protein L5 [Nitrosopumilus sp. b1]KAF6242776.1 50S ribosomal protein L5 [Nitrosopumilus sp. b1]